MKRLLCAWIVVVVSACGLKLPPIVVVPVPPPANTTPPAPTPEPDPVPVPAPTPEPTPEPAPEPPLVNLNIVVHDANGAGIATAACSVNGEGRKADGGGFINFAVRGPVIASCSAPGYVSRSADLPPGDHRFPLVAIEQPKPPAPKPTPAQPVSACGSAANRNGVSHGCLASVAETSKFYETCKDTGSTEACHHYVRDVVRALNTSSGTDRWGLLRKTQGGDNVDGYGTDVIAFLPERFPLTAITWEWLGVDVIGGIGAPGARFQAGNFNPVISCKEWKEGMSWCQRESDIWAAVPK